MKNIVILGGGFAGVAAGLSLVKLFDKLKANITLIDKTDFHFFTPSLYEVATSEQPQKNIAIPYTRIFDSQLNIVVDTIEQLRPKTGVVFLKSGKKHNFDYLIICLGSQTTYFNIKGMQEYSFPLKTLSDAVRIKDAIEKLYRIRKPSNRKIRIVIGGGGFSGCELAAELTNYNDRLSKLHPQYQNPLEVTVIEGADRLLNSIDPKVSAIAQKRLEANNVDLLFNSLIKKVTKDEVQITSREMYPYDLLIWTGGIKANEMLTESDFNVNSQGQVKVNTKLKVASYENIFSAGDCAEFIDPNTKKPVSWLGQVAKDQGRIAAENVYRQINNLELKDYNPKNYGVLVPLKGRYVVAALNYINLAGLIGWLLQQLAFLRYLLGILPVHRAFKRWNKFERDLEQD